MQLYYEGVEISGQADIVSCVHRETSGGRCDTLEMELDHADAWFRWNPQVDDKIIAAMNGYQTGILYLNTVYPQNGMYRIIATSVPSAARRKANASYSNLTLTDLIESCAAECGMESGLYEMDGDIRYSYLLRSDASAAAFMNHLAEREGAAFKTAGGRFAMIGTRNMQATDAGQVIQIGTNQQGVTYIKREDKKWSALRILTPEFECMAQDAGAAHGNYITMTNIPATNEVEAGRWARGLLLTHNRKAEKLTVSSEFNAGFSAMARIDIASETEMSGAWIVDEVEHDMVAAKSVATMVRCVETVS